MKIDKNYKEDFLKLIETELTIKAVCSKLGIARQTVYRWMHDDKAFAKAVQRAIRACALEVNDECESRILDRIRKDDVSMIKFWLRYHHPDYKQSYILTKSR